ncbi:hypothetical protein TCAL_03511 [Tigriopus californicus]|uniref:Uncharacterized protein n=1 Tax=Tigriopus californicus TaxID=6832 RepID=A0A553PEQ2_TIGCA|nr:hypothetical protein TCAL_03511 [Tigriopus californicus]
MVQPSSIGGSPTRKVQTSFFHYISSEVTRGYELEHDEARYTARRQKMYTFMRIPRELEKFMSYGFFQCLDSFLFVFTFLPLRFVLACLALLWRVPLVWLGALRPYHGRSLFPAEIIDLLKGLIIAVCVYSMTHIDTSVMYHMIKSQSVIKLYLFYNMLEVGDRLFSAFGQDTIDALFWTATEPRNRKRETIGVIPHFLLTVTYFVELKASVFKKFDKNNLFQVSCSDVRERFHLFALLFVVVVQTMKEYGWREESFWSMAPDCLTVLMAEFIVDWLKHAFITRFNEVSAEVYKDYTISLAYDLAQTKQKHALSDHSDLVSRRMGFMPLPLGVVMIRVIWTSIRFNGWGAGIVFVLAYLCLLTFRILGSIVILGKACDLIDQHQAKQKETPLPSATTTTTTTSASASSSSTATSASTHPSSKQQAQKATSEHHHPLAANNDKAARRKDSGISVTPFAPVMPQSQVDQLAQNVLQTNGREGNQSDKDTGEASLVSSVLVPKVHDTNIGVNTLKAKKNDSSGEPQRARDGKITLASTPLGPPSCSSSLSSSSSSSSISSSSVLANKDSKLNKAGPFSAAGVARDHENPKITTPHKTHDDGMLDERVDNAQIWSQGSQSGTLTPTTLSESRFSGGLSGSHLLPDLLTSTSQGTTVPTSAVTQGRRETALLMQKATLTRVSDQEGSTLQPSNSSCGSGANSVVQTLSAAEGLQHGQLKENNHKGEQRGHLPQSIEKKNNDNGDTKLGLMQTSVDTQSGDGTSSRCCPGLSRVEVVSNGNSQATWSGSHTNTISEKQLSEIGWGDSGVVQAKGHCVDGNGNPNAKLKPISGPNSVSDESTFMSTEKCSHKVDGPHQGETTSAMPCGVETCWSYGRNAPDSFRQHSNHRVRTSTVCTTGDIDLPHSSIVSFSSNEEASEGSCCSPGGTKGCASSTSNSSPLRLRSLSSPDFMKNDRVFDAERDWPVVIDSGDETEHVGDAEDHMMLQEAHEVHTQTASLLSAVATLVQSASNRGSRHNSSDDCPALRQRLSSGETSASIIQLDMERSSSDGKGNPA